ncbi:cyclase/dehydrase, partial [Cyathus striatus]
SPFEPQTHRYQERKVLPYGAQELYKVVADVRSYPKFIPYCIGSRIITTPEKISPQGTVVMDAELTVGFLSFKESYVSRVTCIPSESVEVCTCFLPIAVASSSTPLFKTLSTIWRFQPIVTNGAILAELVDNRCSGTHRSNSTVVTLDLEYAFTNPLHASISSSFFEQVSKLMVNAFEERCLQLYGS